MIKMLLLLHTYVFSRVPKGIKSCFSDGELLIYFFFSSKLFMEPVLPSTERHESSQGAVLSYSIFGEKMVLRSCVDG